MSREEPRVVVQPPVSAGNCLCPICTYGLLRPKELKAEKLLQEVLGPEEYGQLHSLTGLRIPSRLLPGVSYVIQAVGRCMLADKDGDLFGHLCLVPVGDVPLADHVLGLVLLARTNEERLLASGNVFGPPTETLIQVRQVRERLPAPGREPGRRPGVALRLALRSAGQWIRRTWQELWQNE
jgi:hypothetical protein